MPIVSMSRAGEKVHRGNASIHRLPSNGESDDVFVSLEGIDFTGKTTIARKLEQGLREIGIRPLVTHDPPDFLPWATLKREFLDKATRLSREAEAMLFLAARLDNTARKIAPALAAGRVVIADRYSDSWIAYWAPRLSDRFGSLKAALDWLRDVRRLLRNKGLELLPRRTYLLLDDPYTALRRAPERSRSKWERAGTLKVVQEVYLALAKQEPTRFNVFDIRGLGIRDTAEEVVQDATDYVAEFLRI